MRTAWLRETAEPVCGHWSERPLRKARLCREFLSKRFRRVEFVTALAALVALVAVTEAKASYYAKAKKVVYQTFPASTRDAALRVVGCETGHDYTPWSYNSSGASGLFQILTGNAGRVLYYAGQKLTIVGWYGPRGHQQNLLFNPWYNARVALFLSRGGTDWGEWSCQP